MTREGTRLIAVLAAAILAAALLAACGGSDATTSASTSEGTATQGSTGQGGSHKANGDGAQAKKNGGGGTGTSAGSGGGTGFTPQALRVSGGGSAQFRQKGGDNSIQEFGEEAGESELTEAAEAMHGYLVARAEEDWSKSCSYLSKNERQQLEQLGSQSPQLKNGGCPAIVKALSSESLTNVTRRELTEVDAASLRTEGEQSFLLYRGAGNTAFFVSMIDEDGGWKVGALSPSAFP